MTPASRTGEVLGLEPPPPWSQVGRKPAGCFCSPRAGMREAYLQCGRLGHLVAARPCLFHPPQLQSSLWGAKDSLQVVLSPNRRFGLTSPTYSKQWHLTMHRMGMRCDRSHP
jgi:hypothetical protein